MAHPTQAHRRGYGTDDPIAEHIPSHDPILARYCPFCDRVQPIVRAVSNPARLEYVDSPRVLAGRMELSFCTVCRCQIHGETAIFGVGVVQAQAHPVRFRSQANEPDSGWPF